VCQLHELSCKREALKQVRATQVITTSTITITTTTATTVLRDLYTRLRRLYVCMYVCMCWYSVFVIVYRSKNNRFMCSRCCFFFFLLVDNDNVSFCVCICYRLFNLIYLRATDDLYCLNGHIAIITRTTQQQQQQQ